MRFVYLVWFDGSYVCLKLQNTIFLDFFEVMSTQNNKYAHKLYLNLAKNDFVYSFLCGTSVIFLHWFTLEEDVIKKYTILWKNP